MLQFFKNIFSFLNDHSINYMLCGSVAISICMVPGATGDMEVVIELLPEDVEKPAAHFSKEYYCDKDAVLDAIRRKAG